MATTDALQRAPATGRPGVLLPVVLALGAGVAVAAASMYGIIQQVAFVLVAGVGVPALLLFVLRPHVAIAGYLLVLPLVLPWSVALGLNAGEMLTLATLLLGAISLWEAQDRVAPALRALAPVLWPLVALAVISVLSLLVNGVGDFEEIVSALFKVLAFGLVAVLVHIHSDSPEKTRRMLLAALIGAGLVGFYAVVAYVLGWSYDAQYDWNRASGTFEHWNMLGGFMALMSMPTLALAVSSRSATAKAAFAAGFVLQIAALFLSLTLGSVLALVLAGIFAVVFLVRLDWSRLAIAAFLALSSFAVILATNETLRDKILRIDERVIDRLSTYAVGVSMFRDKFWFGFGSEQRLLDELWFGEADYGLTIFGASSSIPHNSILRIGVEKGVFGVVAFALLLLGALRVLLRDRERRLRGPGGSLYLGLLVGAFAFLIQNMTNDLVLHARIGILFFALVALADRMREQTAS